MDTFRNQFDPPLDPGIAQAVKILREGGIETCESCEGGVGHAFPDPTVVFHGQQPEGFRGFAWATQHGLKIRELRRVWQVIDGELHGPYWELVLASNSNRDHVAISGLD